MSERTGMGQAGPIGVDESNVRQRTTAVALGLDESSFYVPPPKVPPGKGGGGTGGGKPPDKGKGPKDKSSLELRGGTWAINLALAPPISYRPKFPVFLLPPIYLPPPKRTARPPQFSDGAKAARGARKFTTVPIIAPVIAPPTIGGGPGWKLFGHEQDGYHPPSKRAPKAETLERDLQRAYNRANDIEDEDDRRDAVREIKATAATALSVGKKADDQRLVALAQQIIALKALKLQTDIYLERVGMILAAQAPEADDMEALMFMAQFV